MKTKHSTSPFLVPPGTKISLKKDYDPGYTDDYTNKKDAVEKLQADIEQLAKYQDMLYAQDTYALLLIFQAMDAAGKDGTIKHVMSGVNPQGCDVSQFQGAVRRGTQPRLPLALFASECRNAGGSAFSTVPITRKSWSCAFIPRSWKPSDCRPRMRGKGIWKRRFEEINNFEKYITDNGIVVLKFFLNVSKAEQKKRFLERIDRPEKNWKFSASDAKERAYWDDYQQAYEEVFNHTSTEWAPWHIIPADHKWFTRLAVAGIVLDTLKKLKLRYPTVSDDRKQELLQAREILEKE